MSNFPLHLQGSFPPSGSSSGDGFRQDNPETAGLMHQNIPFQNENSPHPMAPQYASGVLSPLSSASGGFQVSTGIHRPYHSGSIYKSDPMGLPPGGSSVPHYPFSTSTPPPLSNSMTSPPMSSLSHSVPTPPPLHAPAPTPPPTQPTPPPSMPSATRKPVSTLAGSSSSRGDPLSLLSKEKIEQLAKTVDPNLKLDDDVQEFLQQHAGELIDELAGMSAKLAHARKSKTLELQDVRYYLEHNWNIYIPGFGADPVKAKKKLPETEAHRNRQAIIKKHLKKF